MILNKLIWYNEYLTGIEIIDQQHKDIFQAFNKFYEFINTGELDRVVIKEFMQALDYYTTVHFETEEKFMLENNYIFSEEHRERHKFFRSLYEEITENKFINHSSGHLLSLHLATISGEWWESHIVTYDEELTNFLKLLNIS